jgi:hypothetical protein
MATAEPIYKPDDLILLLYSDGRVCIVPAGCFPDRFEIILETTLTQLSEPSR